MSVDKIVLAPVNEILGIASTNVPAYSNTNDEIFNIERHYLYGIFMGIKWQCVEYARRWLLLRKGCVFKNIRCAADIWNDINHVERVTDGKHFPLKPYPNGSPTFPQIDSFLIYSRSTEQPVGHIAVICDVGSNYIRIAEQNNKFHYWSGDYARQIPVIFKDGLYYIEDEDEIYGWMAIEDNNQLKSLDQLDLNTILSQYQEPPPKGKIERSTVPRKTDSTNISWLNKDDPAEKFFLEHYGEKFEKLNNSSSNLPYYKINFDFLLNVGAASNELHRMFLEATNRVIHDDELLTRFGIPNEFWNRIRHSWINDQNLAIAGQLDLAFDGNHLKALEYNADTASTLFECACLQKKWAEAIELPSTFTTARWLHDRLIGNWKKLNITTKVHLFIQNNEDEMLTALYMQNIMKEANIISKICLDIKQFFWKDDIIIDSDGETVQFIWKLWTWDTILQDYIDTTKNDNSTKHLNGTHPRISDIFLNDQIKVIEPLWKVITSNKGLLTILSQMYPNHTNLLNSQWNLTDQFKQTSFVKKPIVGQGGQNVTLYNPQDDSVIDETMGNFGNRHSIYQDFVSLKNNDGYYSIINSWIIRGYYAGFCVREDQSLIINNNSQIIPCCIVWEEQN